MISIKRFVAGTAALSLAFAAGQFAPPKISSWVSSFRSGTSPTPADASETGGAPGSISHTGGSKPADVCGQRWKEIAAFDPTVYDTAPEKEIRDITIRKWEAFLSDLSKLEERAPCEHDDGAPADLMAASRSFSKWCSKAKQMGVRSLSEGIDFDPGQRRSSFSGTAFAECLSWFAVVREGVADYVTEGVPLQSLTDVRKLTDKLHGHVRRNPRDLRLSRAIAERILELEPTNYPAAQEAFLLAYTEFRRAMIAGRTPAKSADVENAYSRMGSLVQIDSYHRHFKLHYDVTVRDYAAAAAEAQALLNEPNGREIGEYYLAQIAFEQGKTAEAREGLARIARRQGWRMDHEALLAISRIDRAVKSGTLAAAAPFVAPDLFVSGGVLLYPSDPDAPKPELHGVFSLPTNLIEDFAKSEEPDVVAVLAKIRKRANSKLALGFEALKQE